MDPPSDNLNAQFASYAIQLSTSHSTDGLRPDGVRFELMIDKNEEIDFPLPEIESRSWPDPRSKLQNYTDITLRTEFAAASGAEGSGGFQMGRV